MKEPILLCDIKEKKYFLFVPNESKALCSYCNKSIEEHGVINWSYTRTKWCDAHNKMANELNKRKEIIDRVTKENIRLMDEIICLKKGGKGDGERQNSEMEI